MSAKSQNKKTARKMPLDLKCILVSSYGDPDIPSKTTAFDMEKLEKHLETLNIFEKIFFNKRKFLENSINERN